MAQKTNVNPVIKNKVLNFANLLKKSGIAVEKIILYGSHTKGTAGGYSDIDLCVVSPIFSKKSDYYFKKVWHLAAKIDSALEPIPFTPKELSNKYSTLSFEINKNGVRIV